MKNAKAIACLAVLLLSVSLFAGVAAATDGQSGAMLAATVTATPQWTKTFAWSITSSATPTTLSLCPGDSGTSSYAVSVTKNGGTEAAYFAGVVVVTNGGAVATENLTITVDVTQPQPQQHTQTVIAFTSVNVNNHPTLAAGEKWSYHYQVNVPLPPSAGATYKVTAHITITNHAGHTGPFGPDQSATAVWTSNITLVHDSITVKDSNGQTWTTAASGTTASTYQKTFTSPADCGPRTNKATVYYNDDQQTVGLSAQATVTVDCSCPRVTR